VPFEDIVADANVLLSAVVGKAAQRVFCRYNLRVHVSRFNAHEVGEYLPFMARKYGLPPELVDMRRRILRLVVHEASEYSAHLGKALADLQHRDPEDAHALAWLDRWAIRFGRMTDIWPDWGFTVMRRPGC
jgi:predicted nucleic acid-binding protein